MTVCMLVMASKNTSGNEIKTPFINSSSKYTVLYIKYYYLSVTILLVVSSVSFMYTLYISCSTNSQWEIRARHHRLCFLEIGSIL